MGKSALRLLALLYLALATLGDFTSNCPEECHCGWASGSKQAKCSNHLLQNIPTTFSPDIQILDLTGNNLTEITGAVFRHLALINLKKLVLRDCKLVTIHKNALSGQALMIELDLSQNKLKTLHADTFKETLKIRWIFLNDNKLEKLEDGLFNNLPFLLKVDVSNNQIVTLGVNTFKNVPKLCMVKLNGNKLEHVTIETLSVLRSYSNLELYDNPWRCDCNLRPFRDWFMSMKFDTSPISCAEPPAVHGQFWKELKSTDFACQPRIVYPAANTTLTTSDTNITISCRADGNPQPEVNWVRNAQIIDGSYRDQGEIKHYIDIAQSTSGKTKQVYLTIINAGSKDNGDYVCVAKNRGGSEERSLTLAVTPISSGTESN